MVYVAQYRDNLYTAFSIIDQLKESFSEYCTDVSKTEMMGISDHIFMLHSWDMPYRKAVEAYYNLKHCVCFRFPGSRTGTINARQFLEGVNISSVARPKRNVYVFNYNYNDDTHVFMYEKETGSHKYVSHLDAEDRLRKLLFKFGL